MRFDALIGLVVDRADRQVPLEFFEGLLDLHQLQIERPEFRRIAAREIGSQQITAFPPACLPQLLPVQLEAESLRRDRLVLAGQLDVDDPISDRPRFRSCSSQLDQQLIPGQLLLA